jgi:hypothetical protein
MEKFIQKKSIILLLMFVLALPAVVYAGNWNTNAANIESIRMVEGTVYVQLSVTVECESLSTNQFKMDAGRDGVKETYAMLLGAYLTNKKVKVWLEEAAGNFCSIGGAAMWNE